MAPSLFLLPLLLSLQQPAHATLIRDVCKSVSENQPAQTISYDFCVSSLESDRRSRSASAQELAVIAIRLAAVNATATRAKIERLVKEEADDSVAVLCLEGCRTLYSQMVAALARSARAVKGGDGATARAELGGAEDKPWSCDDMLFEGGKDQLLEEENVNAAGLAAIAREIVNELD